MTLPFENDTNSFIKKLASAQLKKERLKKIFTIVAISLATFLMASVLLLVSGIITVNQNGGNNITGSYHALISSIEKEQYQKLSDDVRVDLCGFTASIGSVKSGKDRLNISYSNNDALTLNGLCSLLIFEKQPNELFELSISIGYYNLVLCDCYFM